MAARQSAIDIIVSETYWTLICHLDDLRLRSLFLQLRRRQTPHVGVGSRHDSDRRPTALLAVKTIRPKQKVVTIVHNVVCHHFALCPLEGLRRLKRVQRQRLQLDLVTEYAFLS